MNNFQFSMINLRCIGPSRERQRIIPSDRLVRRRHVLFIVQC